MKAFLHLVAVKLFVLGLSLPNAEMAQAQVDPPNNPPKISWLAYIPFDDTNWISTFYYPPISFTNISNVPAAGDGNAMLLDSTNSAWLQYRVVEDDGTTNLLLNEGSVTFWIYPNWLGTNYGGAGPGTWGRMIELGSYTEDASYGWWSLYFNAEGTQIYFSGQSNDGSQATYLSAPINWSSNAWHMLALTYCATNTSLYIDGLAVVTNGVGVTLEPPPDVLSNGFFIGSDNAGTSQARAIFDDFFTFEYPLDAAGVADIFQVFSIAYFGAPVSISKFASAPSYPTNVPTFRAFNGNGNLVPVVTNVINCVASSNVWITNVIATMGSNGTINVAFTIAGGSNAVPYDVFANSALIFSTDTNSAWGWMGQGYKCVTYTLSSLTNSACFLILGQPQDSDADGLSDAYEQLVTKSDPHNADTSGDGMLDGWKALWGMDPRSNNVSQPGQRANYGYDPAGFLKRLSGFLTEAFDPDAEGNIRGDSQN